jgi:nucleoid-associated protein YgaU
VNEPFSLFEPVELFSWMETNLEKKAKSEIETQAEAQKEIKEEAKEELNTETKPQENSVYFKPVDIHRSHIKNSQWPFIASCILILLLITGSIFFFDKEESEFPEPLIEQTQVIEEDTIPVIPDTLSSDFPVPEQLISEKIADKPVSVSGKKRTIQDGDRLTTIAFEEYGNKNFWIYLYEENKQIMKNPDQITSGMTIIIPPAEKYGINKKDEKSIEEAKKAIGRLSK